MVSAPLESTMKLSCVGGRVTMEIMEKKNVEPDGAETSWHEGLHCDTEGSDEAGSI